MYKGETLSLDGNESVGIGLPALMSQTKVLLTAIDLNLY